MPLFSVHSLAIGGLRKLSLSFCARQRPMRFHAIPITHESYTKFVPAFSVVQRDKCIAVLACATRLALHGAANREYPPFRASRDSLEGKRHIYRAYPALYLSDDRSYCSGVDFGTLGTAHTCLVPAADYTRNPTAVWDPQIISTGWWEPLYVHRNGCEGRRAAPIQRLAVPMTATQNTDAHADPGGAAGRGKGHASPGEAPAAAARRQITALEFYSGIGGGHSRGR